MNKEVILRNDQEVERIKFEDVKTSDIIGYIDGSGKKGFFIYKRQNGSMMLSAVTVNTELDGGEWYQEVTKAIKDVPIARMIVFGSLQGPDGLYAWLSKE